MYVFTTLGVLIGTVLLYIHLTLKKSCKFFKKNGIPYIEPKFLFGNTKDVILHQKAPTICYQELYEKLQPHRFAGIFEMHTGSILIRDPILVNQILMKDFSYFNQHVREKMKETDPLAHNLFTMKDEEWKNTRTKLTSTFSSGKLKIMFPLVKKCGEDMVKTLQRTITDPRGFEARDLSARYAIDVIGSYAFGIETHSLENPQSEFRQMIKRIFANRWQAIIRGFFPTLPAKCIKFFGLETYEKEASDYLENIIKNEVKRREQNNISRGDFLDLLIDMKRDTDVKKLYDNDNTDVKGNKTVKTNVEMTTETMAAHSFLFFSGGYSTIAIALSFLLFELAQNPDVQNKARSEILSTLKRNNGDLTYEMLTSMSYLNMVIAEILRKHPPGGFIHRKCSKNYQIPQSNVIIKKGTLVIISIRGIHNDEKYYEKPNEFYPEHFSESAKAVRPPFTYLPFGDGPRSCIAERFAKIQVTVGIIYILKHFILKLSPKTKLPLEFIAGLGSTAITAKGGIWLKCRAL